MKMKRLLFLLRGAVGHLHSLFFHQVEPQSPEWALPTNADTNIALLQVFCICYLMTAINK